jgi:hypothetical protein
MVLCLRLLKAWSALLQVERVRDAILVPQRSPTDAKDAAPGRREAASAAATAEATVSSGVVAAMTGRDDASQYQVVSLAAEPPGSGSAVARGTAAAPTSSCFRVAKQGEGHVASRAAAAAGAGAQEAPVILGGVVSTPSLAPRVVMQGPPRESGSGMMMGEADAWLFRPVPPPIASPPPPTHAKQAAAQGHGAQATVVPGTTEENNDDSWLNPVEV